MDIHKADTIKKLRPHLHLKISLKILRYMGAWPAEMLGFARILYFTYTFCFFASTVGVYLFVEIVDIIINYNNINRIASVVPVFITNALQAYKFITVVRYHKRIEKLMSVLDSPIFSKDNVRYERIVSWYAWQGLFHYGVYQINGFLAVLFWACSPVANIVNGEEGKLPLTGWYPYDTTKSFSFIITWAHQGIAIILCCINNISIDLLIVGLISVASCQFEILKWNLASVGNNIEEERISSNNTEKYKDNKIDNQLRSYVEHYLAIINFVKEIQNIFNTVLGLQLFFSCFEICISTFYLSQMSFSPMELIGNIGYVLAICNEVFIFTFLGNDLYLQNDSLSDAIYMGNWWKLKPRYKRALQIIMLRTRRPLILSASFLMKLSISTFVSIIQTSYSMFMLLHKKNDS